jgi:hypothetical protein
MVSTIGMMFGILALAMCTGFLAGIYDLWTRQEWTRLVLITSAVASIIVIVPCSAQCLSADARSGGDRLETERRELSEGNRELRKGYAAGTRAMGENSAEGTAYLYGT